jgi:hypothetical protein
MTACIGGTAAIRIVGTIAARVDGAIVIERPHFASSIGG